MDYLLIPSTAGLNLMASLAVGSTLNIVRVGFGDGVLNEYDDPAALTDLIHHVADGVAGKLSRQDNIVNLTVEFQNDLNGGLQTPFWLREFGIYCLDEEGSEVMVWRGDLLDLPMPVSAWDGRTIDVRQFPLTFPILGDLEIQLSISGGLVLTSADLEAHNADPTAHPDIRELIAAMQLTINDLANKVQLLEDAQNTIVLTADLVSLSNVSVMDGVWAAGSLSAAG